MKTKIFYFSGTGNSLSVARKIANGIGESEVIAIPNVINKIKNIESETVGFVFPVYGWGLPRIIVDFIKSNAMWLKPCKTGIESVTYNEIEEGKLEQAINWLYTFMGAFAVIDGYGYEFDLMASQQELLAAQQQQE